MIYINFYTKAMYHFWYTDTKNGITHIPKVVFCPITVNNLTQ